MKTKKDRRFVKIQIEAKHHSKQGSKEARKQGSKEARKKGLCH